MKRLLSLYRETKISEDILITGTELFFLCQSNGCSMIASFSEDCIIGEFVKRTDPNTIKNYNTLSQFYIDDRVKFNGKRQACKLIEKLKKLFEEVYPKNENNQTYKK